jgi:flagellar hook-associated protein 3 FlgL
MSDRISSYATTGSLMQQALRLQSNYTSTVQQQSSGLKSETFSGIAGDAKKILNLESQFSSITANIAAINTAQQRITSMQGALEGMTSLFTTVLSQLSAAQSGSNADSLTNLSASTATDWRDTLVGLLNTEFAGGYLFGGSDDTIKPVNLSAVGYDSASQTAATADTGYYQGDASLDTVRASGSLTVTYGVTANNAAFEKAIRALTLVTNNPNDSATIQSAYTLMQEAANGVADLSAILTSKASLLEQQANMHTATLDYIDSAISDLRNVDIAATTVQLTQMETQLEASYSTLSNLLNLKLTDYLR